MAHAAKIGKDNIVENVIVVPDEALDENESDESVQKFCEGVGLEGNWIRTSYNGNIRYNFGKVGDIFDPSAGDNGAFFEPQPFNSWVLDKETYIWFAPIPQPEPGKPYVWDEETLSWIKAYQD